jgi:hypothetical protein
MITQPIAMPHVEGAISSKLRRLRSGQKNQIMKAETRFET